MNENKLDRELSWDDVIENDEIDRDPLPEGDYDFEVLSFERGRHPGSTKIPPCPQAVLRLRISDGKGNAREINDFLKLHSKMEWQLCSFFAAIGHRRKGEALRMDWSKVPGARGRCSVVITEKTGSEGRVRRYNNIDRYLPPEEGAPQTPKFTPGVF